MSDNRELFVHSGECCLCQIGIETGSMDRDGKPVHTGDIVILYYCLDPENDIWEIERPLTVVVSDQFTSYSDGSVKIKDGAVEFFTMGIRSVGISSDRWQVSIAKKFSDVVPGEHWPQYGFSYRENHAAAISLVRALEAAE